jgi:hypothetical protein
MGFVDIQGEEAEKGKGEAVDKKDVRRAYCPKRRQMPDLPALQ